MDLDGITGLGALALAGGQYFVLQPRCCGFDALFGSILSQIGLAFFAVLVCQCRKGRTLLFHFAALERLHHFSYLLLIQRSEERRVGKECRSRWSRGDVKKNRSWAG